tara:strand:+ start:22272 stop:22667 length:396 start_codon:yes stop_codon:yes gene_type:complete
MVRGLQNVISNFEKYNVNEKKRITNACKIWAVDTASDAKELAPSDTGTLRNSAFYDYYRAENTRKSTAKMIFRAGFTANYAPYVHEMLTPSKGVKRTSGSKKGFYWEVGQPKFLEIAARKNLIALRRRLRG